MNYIVFDMEWNQPSYSGGRKKIGDGFLTGEIIQIGAVKLDGSMDVCDSFNVNIEPVFYKKMNSAVKRITGITDSELRGCKHFREAFSDFVNFCGEDFCFITWGRDDMPMLRENMLAHGLNPDTLARDYDLQRIFNHQVTHDSRQWSLSGAMEKLGIEQRHPAHNALFDAVNTAKIALRLDLAHGIENYNNLMILAGIGGKKETIGGYSDLKAALYDKNLRRTVCPVCGAQLRGGKWIGTRGKRVALADCPEHGTLKFVITAYRAKDGFCATRRVLPASAEMIASYSEKLAAVR